MKSVSFAVIFLFIRSSSSCQTSAEGTWIVDESVDLCATSRDPNGCLSLCYFWNSIGGAFKGCTLNRITWTCCGIKEPGEFIDHPDYIGFLLSKYEDGIACYGSDATQVATSSAEACKEECEESSTCRYYTYFNENSNIGDTCFLFDECPEKTECSNCEYGELSCFPDTLPEECSNYRILDGETRTVNHHGDLYYCDDEDSHDRSPDWQGPSWYRMQAPAGKVIPEKSPGKHHCGTGASGWAQDKHPEKPGEKKNIKICFEWGDDPCSEWTHVDITHCGDFYVYYLDNIPYCSDRYCASDDF